MKDNIKSFHEIEKEAIELTVTAHIKVNLSAELERPNVARVAFPEAMLTREKKVIRFKVIIYMRSYKMLKKFARYAC